MSVTSSSPDNTTNVEPTNATADSVSVSNETTKKVAQKKKSSTVKTSASSKKTSKPAANKAKTTTTPKKAAPKAKGGVRRKGPIGSKAKKTTKATKVDIGMRICFRCNSPFEPVAEDEVICPKCLDSVNTRFESLFGDEDPYSPQPTLRTNKIARVIIRKNQANLQKKEDEKDDAEKNLEPIDRYDDD
jgi:hypothetical protein